MVPSVTNASAALESVEKMSKKETGIQELIQAHFTQEKCPVEVIKGDYFIQSFTVSEGKLYLLTLNSIKIFDFEKSELIREIPVSLGCNPYHIAIFEKWIVCAAKESGVLAFFDKEKEMPAALVNLESVFEKRKGGIQEIVIHGDAIYASMWTFPENGLGMDNKNQKGHIVKVERNKSTNLVFCLKSFEDTNGKSKCGKVIFDADQFHLDNLKSVEGKLYFANEKKVFSFNEETNTAKEILDAGVYIWSFDIIDGAAVVKKEDDDHSVEFIHAAGGFLLYSNPQLKIRRIQDNAKVKKRGPQDYLYNVKKIEICTDGALVALEKSYQGMNSALYIFRSVA